jgi:hypothetical protein
MHSYWPFTAGTYRLHVASGLLQNTNVPSERTKAGMRPDMRRVVQNITEFLKDRQEYLLLFLLPESSIPEDVS